MGQQMTVRRRYVGEGLFVEPRSATATPQLLGSRCPECGEVTFPKQQRCAHCASEAVVETALSPRGTLYSFSNVNYPVPEGYRGPVPYGVGIIELPDGVRIMAHLTESDPARLAVGMDMELVIDRLFTEEDGTEVIGFKFRPVVAASRGPDRA